MPNSTLPECNGGIRTMRVIEDTEGDAKLIASLCWISDRGGFHVH
jgi:hypothetical protein